MFLRFSLIGIISMCVFLELSAQDIIYGNYQEALLFSQHGAVGSSRFQALGGAQQSLGADIGSAHANPAGLGVYRKSEMSFTGNFMLSNTSSTFVPDFSGTTYQDNALNGNFNLGNFGVVFTTTDDSPNSSWKAESFAITYNRLNNYHRSTYYEGRNTQSSIRDYYVDDANSRNYNIADYNKEELFDLTEVAYFTYLIDDENSGFPNNRYITYDQGAPVYQSERINYSGANDQWSFAYGANYKDKLYIGVSLGVPRIRYNMVSEYSESVEADGQGYYSGYTINESYGVRGTGVNAKVGVIARPIDVIRIGASIHTPTYYSLRETYEGDINSQLINIVEPYEERTVLFDHRFNLMTPWRYNIGASYFFNKNGFITFDTEYTQFNKATLYASGDNSFRGDNTIIQNNYRTNNVTLRTGAEYRVESMRFRAGYAYYSNPFAAFTGVDGSMHAISGGVGFRFEDYYLDFALVNHIRNASHARYEMFDGTGPSVNSSISNTSLFITFGTNF